MNKVCVRCGTPFEGIRQSKFCGDQCRLERRLEGNKVWGATYRAKNRKPRPEPEPIPPFPDDIDRYRFGCWLSGFADGEATFGLRHSFQKTQGKELFLAYFRISLRDDDAEILHMIRSYLQCGCMFYASNSRSKIKNAKPVAIMAIHAVPDLMNVVIPHFERFPLMAKKRNDFAVWKECVGLMAEVRSRPAIGRLGKGGIEPRWTAEERERFRSLSDELSDQRIYRSLRSN
jgi:hypothetical protein